MSELYNTLFNYFNSSNDHHDITMETINQLHGHNNLNCASNNYNITTYNKLFDQYTNNFNIIHINSRSLPKKVDNITSFFNTLTTSPDILAVTET